MRRHIVDLETQLEVELEPGEDGLNGLVRLGKKIAQEDKKKQKKLEEETELKEETKLDGEQ